MQKNEYIKTWPDIMKGKKILYVHGFASSGQSGTVTLLRTILPSATVVAPDLPIHPHEALELLRSICEKEHPDLIIGSSMGGMMAEQLHGYDRILVNPAFEMGDTMGSHGMIGKLTFRNPRLDGVQELIVTKAIVKEYRETTERRFVYEGHDGIPAEEQQRVWGLFGDNDPIVHTREMFLEHYSQGITFHGGHQLVDSVALHSLIPVVRWIDDRQEKRQRETVYIDFETLHDRRMEAASSMLKAVEALADRYAVYFVAHSPTNNTEHYATVTEWIKLYVGVLGHDHIIFTNTPEMLYGDYYIASRKPHDAMATTIEYGSEHFKTWEEIITYFSRLTE